MKEGKFAQAILEFEMATEGVYEDQPKKIQTYGMHFIQVLPSSRDRYRRVPYR